MKVSDALASAFVKEGVTTVFGLMGNGNMYWWYALDQHPDVTIHETRHEGTALTMAEGWARATGQPGVGTVTEGPGLSQLATALIVAARAKVPMVVLAGDTALNDSDGVQQLDQARCAAATEAGFVPIWEGERGRGGRPDRVLPSSRRVPPDRAIHGEKRGTPLSGRGDVTPGDSQWRLLTHRCTSIVW